MGLALSTTERDCVLALDQGTTSSRAILFDQAGDILGIERQEFTQYFPEPGRVEHDPEDIWYSQLSVAVKLLQNSGVDSRRIASIGITNQRETTLLWDRVTGKPVHNAIVWQDRRTAGICSRLRADGAEEIVSRTTGLTLDPYFSATKVAWLLETIPGLRARAERGEIAFGTVDSFLLWRLTGGRVHATDASNASRTMLYNLRTGVWDAEMLRLFDIPESLLPEVRPSSGIFGLTDAAHFGRQIPIAGIAGDQQAATFGQACLSRGMVKNTYGTGSFILMNTGNSLHHSHHGLLSTVAWDLGTAERRSMTYALEGSVFVTGAAIQWLRDQLQIIRNSHEVEALAASCSDSGGVYFVPAFVGLGAPYWDPDARGALVGLTRGSGRAHIARAALEAACFQSCDVLDAMKADCGLTAIPELRVDGGMTANRVMLQMQADLLGTPVVRPTITETTALGAAYLAGLAVGFWKSTADTSARWKKDELFEPQISEDERMTRLQGWRNAVTRVRSGAVV